MLCLKAVITFDLSEEEMPTALHEFLELSGLATAVVMAKMSNII